MNLLRPGLGELDAGAKAGANGARRIAIVAGGTAGHIYPALAVADAYEAAVPGAEVVFIGNPAGFEAELVGRTHYRFRAIKSSALMRERLRGKARAILNLGSSYVEARRVLRSGGFHLVLGFGSYTCGGAIPAAWALGLKTAIHESNARAGLANRFLGPIVDRAYIGVESAQRDFPSGRACFTGNPVRADVLALFDERRQAPIRDRPFRILVTGGSLGSPFLNRHAPGLIECLAGMGVRVEVRHQSGFGLADEVRALYRRPAVDASVSEYIEDMPEAYRRADFAVTSAGAATMAELAVAGLPALFVPLHAAARNHQLGNAVAFASQGGGWCLEEHAWRVEPIAGKIAALLDHSAAWHAASGAMRRLARPSAAELIVAECERLVGGYGKSSPDSVTTLKSGSFP